MFLLMLAIGGTYQNNLVFMMAFILLALGLVTIIQTARNIRDIEIAAIGITSNFEKSDGLVTLTLKNSGKKSAERLKVELPKNWRQGFAEFEIPVIEARSMASIQIPIRLKENWGVYKLGKVRIGTSFPHGLFRTWFVFKSFTDVYVYPLPQESNTVLPAKNRGDDFSGHKPYATGDSYARMDWKLAARGRGLNTKLFKSEDVSQIELEFKKGKDSVRDFSSKIQAARTNGYEWSLVTREETSGLARGTPHFHRTMKQLVKAALT